MTLKEIAIKEAIQHLRDARALLVSAGAKRAVARVRLAITSAEGAQRHAQGIATRVLVCPRGVHRGGNCHCGAKLCDCAHCDSLPT